MNVNPALCFDPVVDPRNSPHRVDITGELTSRSSRPRDHATENRALIGLAREMATSPHRVLQSLAEAALVLCRAHSAGISLLETKQGRLQFRWQAVAGQWSKYLGGTMPRDLSPCGTVLDRNATILLSLPGRHYPIPEELQPAIVEVLLIPFHVNNRPVGTIWVVAHDEGTKFDAENERVMSNLGTFASSAYQALHSVAALRLSEQRYRALVHASANSVWRMSGDGASMLELKSDVAPPHDENDGPTLEWLRTYIPVFEHEHLSAAWAQAVAKGSFYEHEHQAIAANGEIRMWLSRAVPLLDADGQVREWIGASTDITDRKRAEDELHRTLQTLGAKVSARTAELTEMNEKLGAEVHERRRAETARLDAATRLADAEEAQLRHISRELHDQVGQQLTALSLRLHAMQSTLDGAGRSALGKALTETDAITKIVHDLALELRPSAIDKVGLIPALETYAEEWSRRTRIGVALHQVPWPEKLTDLLEITIYRIVQESLNNVAKHSHATNVSIVLERRVDTILLIVEDNGCGFDVGQALHSEKFNRLGLIGIIERAGLLGGHVDIESEPNNGCSLYCRLPVTPKKEQTQSLAALSVPVFT